MECRETVVKHRVSGEMEVGTRITGDGEKCHIAELYWSRLHSTDAQQPRSYQGGHSVVRRCRYDDGWANGVVGWVSRRLKLLLSVMFWLGSVHTVCFGSS